MDEDEEDDEEEDGVDIVRKEEEGQERDRLDILGGGAQEGRSVASVGVWMGLGSPRAPSLTSHLSYVLPLPPSLPPSLT